jgi:hypothetical protein
VSIINASIVATLDETRGRRMKMVWETKIGEQEIREKNRKEIKIERNNVLRRALWLKRSQISSFSVFVCGLSGCTVFFHIMS